VLLIIAVLEKRLGMNLSSQDVFVNVTGGAKLREPAIDLGIACAVASAFGNFTMDKDGVLIGEVGLGGEIRNVSQVLERLKESERLGLSWAAVPKRGLKEKFVSRQMQVKPVETLEEVVRWMKDAGTLKQEP
jgi:DNA repair protein RadA/Sms